MNLIRWILAFVMVGMVGMVGLVGCGGGGTSTVVSQKSYKSIRALSIGYEGYLNQHKGQPPQDEQALRSYLESRKSDWDAINVDIDDMLVSPRNREPFVVVYGGKLPRGKTGMTYIAYEKTPVEGKRLLVATRGMYEDVDETQFKAVFPDAS